MTRPHPSLADKVAEHEDALALNDPLPLLSKRDVARDLTVIEEKEAALKVREDEFASAVAEVEKTTEYGDLESAKATLKRVRDVALDAPEIHAAKAKVKAAKDALKNVAVYRHAKRLEVEVRELTDAQVEARRALVRRLFGSRRVIETGTAPAMGDGRPTA